ncbi:MAG: hypothetical protein H0T92_08030 [Pyrinomonadaceae bacterium]|nr:hypothetical protein [Pyrinomonadaceae bacterium]
MLTQRRRGRSAGRKAAGTQTNAIMTTFDPLQAPSAQEAPEPQPSTKLHSIPCVTDERNFTGEFNARGTTYQFTFTPTAAEVAKNKLHLIGRFGVRPARGGPVRTTNNVRATLLATQGGIGGSPTRRQLQTGTADDGNVSSTDQKQEQAKAPENAQQTQAPDPSRQTNQPVAGQQQAPETARSAASTISTTQAAGDSSFVGVMYFRLQSLDGNALGVPVDLSNVQLNARLAPVDDVARDLQFLYSELIAAAYGEKPNERNAGIYARELNRILKGGSISSIHPIHPEAQQTATLATHDHIHFQVTEATE